MTLTKQQGVVLVSEQQAERALIEDGFQKVRCAACEGTGHFQLGTGDRWKKYVCETCGGPGWSWQSPPADVRMGAPDSLSISK